jgi:hypothetical protein
MLVEIIERKPTTIVDLGIPNLQLGVAIALTTVIAGIVAFVLLLIRAVSAWESGRDVLR